MPILAGKEMSEVMARMGINGELKHDAQNAARHLYKIGDNISIW